jgi:hypothetical protein
MWTSTPRSRDSVRARALAKRHASLRLPVVRCSAIAIAAIPTIMPRKRYGESATRRPRVSSAARPVSKVRVCERSAIGCP